MSDVKVFYPEEIEDTMFPQKPTVDQAVVSSPSGQTYSPTQTQEQSFPSKRVATELMTSSLNTRSKKILQSFGFTQSGALQIGEYTQGVSGDVKLSPNGIVARNDLGDTTFALDGTTGDAVFKGEIKSGSLVTGEVIVGNNRVIIDGENQTIIINDGTHDRVLIGKQVGGF